VNGLLLDAIVRTSIQGTLLAAIVWLICRLAAKRLDPRARKALWWLVCLKILVGLAWFNPPALQVLPATESVNTPLAVAEQAISSPVSGPSSPSKSVFQATESSTSPIALIWLAGVALMTFRVGRATWRLRKIYADAMPDEGEDAHMARRLAAVAGLKVSPRVVRTGETTSPFAMGWWKPTIVLPTDFSSLGNEDRQMALAHEVAHLRHGDPALNIVPEIARILFFFLPPVWFACREWATEREAVCDNEALAMTGAKARDYREMLLKVAAKDIRPMSAPALGATAEFGLLRRRLERIGRNAKFSFLLGASTVAAAVPSLVPWQLTARPQKGDIALVNPGFETGSEKGPDGWTIGPSFDGIRYIWDHKVKHLGGSSLSIKKTEDRYFPIAQWTQTVPVPTGANTIELSAWIKTAKAYKAILDVQFAGEEGVSSHHWIAYEGAKELGEPPSNHDWVPIGGSATIPAGTTQVILALQDYGPGQVWFDDIKARFSKLSTQQGDR